MKAGTEVKISDEMGGGFALVVGTMTYSDDDRVVLVAGDAALGMPINVQWLTPTGQRDEERAERYRHTYLSKFPNTLKD